MGNCGNCVAPKNKPVHQECDTDLTTPSNASRNRHSSIISPISIKSNSEFQFVLDDDDILINENSPISISSKHDEDPLDVWIKSLVSNEYDSIEEKELAGSESESEESEQMEMSMSMNIKMKNMKIFIPQSYIQEHEQLPLIEHCTTDDENDETVYINYKHTPKPNIYEQTPKPNILRLHETDSWDIRDMENLEREMLQELETNLLPHQSPSLHHRKSSHLVQSEICDWDIEIMEVEEDEMKKYLNHLKNSVTI